VLVICGPRERELAREIVHNARHPRVQGLTEEPLSIGLSKACVRRSRLLVTTDSGPRHFAAAFGVPVVTLFGPTDQAWSENHHPQAINLQLNLDCSPCQQRRCPLRHHRCMLDLSIDEVYRAVKQQLQIDQTAQAA
jgi:heptosyltransferase-2